MKQSKSSRNLSRVNALLAFAIAQSAISGYSRECSAAMNALGEDEFDRAARPSAPPHPVKRDPARVMGRRR